MTHAQHETSTQCTQEHKKARRQLRARSPRAFSRRRCRRPLAPGTGAACGRARPLGAAGGGTRAGRPASCRSCRPGARPPPPAPRAPRRRGPRSTRRGRRRSPGPRCRG
ncbi:unnamed protein product, partial [Heterosigma akashiwo]